MQPARARLLWLAVFGVAFGFVEAAVVIYLRQIHYPDGFRFPLVSLSTTATAVEVLREAATLIMLLSAAALASASAWGRFGAFAFAFGVWDLAFYAGLWLTLGWPESLATWDVLFLIPGIWTGPVWSAAVVAVLLVGCGGRIVIQEDGGSRPPLGAGAWAGASLALALLLAAFLWNHGPAARGESPGWFPWPLWLAGVATGVGTYLALSRRGAAGPA